MVGLVVPTFVRQREVLAREVMQALVQRYGSSRVAFPIPASVKLEQAPAAGGMTIFEYAPESTPALAYGKLVERVFNG